MLKKIVFGFILLFSLYASFSLVSELSSEKYDIEAAAYFDQKDSIVYVIHEARGIEIKSETFKTLPSNLETVSYTHLTLPTILLV